MAKYFIRPFPLRPRFPLSTVHPWTPPTSFHLPIRRCCKIPGIQRYAGRFNFQKFRPEQNIHGPVASLQVSRGFDGSPAYYGVRMQIGPGRCRIQIDAVCGAAEGCGWAAFLRMMFLLRFLRRRLRRCLVNGSSVMVLLIVKRGNGCRCQFELHSWHGAVDIRCARWRWLGQE